MWARVTLGVWPFITYILRSHPAEMAIRMTATFQMKYVAKQQCLRKTGSDSRIHDRRKGPIQNLDTRAEQRKEDKQNSHRWSLRVEESKRLVQRLRVLVGRRQPLVRDEIDVGRNRQSTQGWNGEYPCSCICVDKRFSVFNFKRPFRNCFSVLLEML